VSPRVRDTAGSGESFTIAESSDSSCAAAGGVDGRPRGSTGKVPLFHGRRLRRFPTGWAGSAVLTPAGPAPEC